MTTTATTITAPTVSHILGPLWFLRSTMCERLPSSPSHLGRVASATPTSRRSESFTRSGGQPTAMGSLAAQSLTCIPTSTLLSQPERDTHPPRHGSLGQPRHTLTNPRVPAHMVPKSYCSVKEVGDPFIAQARHTG